MGSTTFCRGLIIFLFSLWFTAFCLKAQPIANFSINLPVPNCNPAVYSFADSSTGIQPLSYQWNFGVYPGVNSIFQNPSTTFLNCGTYTVQLIVIDGNGDADTAAQSVTVWCSPTAIFNTSDVSGCLPYPATFNSSGSIAGSGTLTNYDWDFGDGYSGTGASPNHTYVDAGCKQVTLIVTNSYDCVADTTMNDLLCVYTPPQADFSSTIPTSCSAPFSVTYSDSSTSGLAPYSYEWIFEGGDPAIDTSSNPTVAYNSSGNFSTTLIITDANGCTDTIVYNDYVVIANNTADMTLSAIQGCPPLTISLTGIASSTPIGYSWTITPSGTISNSLLQNASASINDTGTFSICLDIDFGSGCIASKCTTITTHPTPIAFYTVDGLLNTCLRPNPILFSDSSFGSNLSYAWSFPGGSPASANTSSPDTINYVACGTYSASLTVTDDFGCADSYTTPNFMTTTCPVANFVADPTSGCVPLNVNFNSTSSTNNPVSWVWDFGDPSSGAANTSTSQNPSHTYNNPGCYTISLITTNAEGCKDTVVMPNEVCAGTLPVAAFTATPTVNCANQPIYFTNQSTGTFNYTTYTWDFYNVPPYDNNSNSTNPSHVYNDTGWFDITLIVSNYGCNDTLTIDQMVHLLPPVAIATLSRTCAQPYVVTLNGSSSLGVDHYTWVIPSGNPPVAFTPIVSVTYTASGNYTATLFVTNDSTGCTDQTNVSIPIRDVEANFTGTPLSGCAPLTSCMTNSSVDAVSYNWLVTNSSGTTVTTSTSTNPCFTLTTPGIYSVRLIATDMFGCKDTLIRTAYITVYAPVVNFSGLPLSGCSPLTVDFTDITTAPTSTPVSWSWNFGDPTSGVNNTSTLQNPSHTYNLSGWYTVTLSVTDDHGCTKSKTISNYIHVIHPEASFILTDTTVCQGTTACFINTSTGTGLTYDWDFGNGNTSTSSNPCYTYTVNGFYDITLIATDLYGCIDTVSINDYVNVTKPTANLIADTLGSSCPPLLVHFTNLSVDIDSSSTYYWQFGDGQVSSAPNPTHIYNIAGTFDVTLIVTNQNGCKDTIVFADYITIGGPEGFINLLPTSGCVPHHTCFEATSPTTISFTWNFGDGAVEVGGDSICHTYTSTGTFYSELILNDGIGCVYAIPVGVVVVNGANCDFNLDNPYLCDNGTTQFTDASYGTSPVAQWDWNFGDAASGAQNISTLQNPSHFFASPGTYSISLDITTVDGCTNSHLDTVIVQPAPVTYFARVDSSVCAPDTIHFFDETVSSSPIVNWYWNFDDPASGTLNTDTLPNTLHFYQFPGTYNVTLTVVAENGCSDIISLPVYVHDTVIANAGPDQIICSGSSALLTASGGANYSWSPTAGLSNPNVSSPIATPTISTTYTVIISNIFGCFDIDSAIVTVNPLPVVSSLTGIADTCADNHAQATVIAGGGTPGYTYLWNTNPIQTSASVINLHGGNTYTVIITDANGCTVSSSLPITDLPGPNANASDNNSTCGYSNGNAWVTVAGGNGGNIYIWNTGATTTTISNLPSGNYEVTVTDQFGCSDEDDTYVSNIAGPTATISANNTTCGNSNSFVNLTANGGTSPKTYSWNTGATTQDLTNMAAGTYSVTVTDANACTAIATTTFINIPGPSISFTQVDATCQLNNGSIDVTLSNGTAPFNYNWNGFAFTTQDLTNIYSGTYNLTVTDANGCTAFLSVTIGDTPIPAIAFSTIASTCGNNNGSIDVTTTGGATPYTFLWSNGGTTEDIDSLFAGAYNLSVTGANGCVVDTIVNLNDLSAPVLSINPIDNTCSLDNGSIDLALVGGTPAFTYLWSNGETTQDISNLAIGNYFVTVTDGNGCLAFDNATLINIPGPTLSSSADSSTCGNANGAIDVITSGGTAPYNYAWSNGATDEDLLATVAGAYSVTITDANSCTAFESQTINNIDGPAISYSTINSTCGNSNGSIDISVTGGTAPYAYDWNSGAFTSEDLTNIPTGIYMVVVTDQHNCTINSIITLNNTAGPTLSAIDTNTTCGNANGVIDLTVSGGIFPFVFDWNSGSYTTEDINNLSTGSYTVVVTDSNLCTTTITEIIVDVAGPTASAIASDVTCSANNGTVTLTIVDGTSPYTFIWNNGTTTQHLSGLTTGIYDVTITDANLCTTTASAIVSDVPGPFSAMATSSATCGNNNGSIDLDVTAGIAPYNYVWSNGATTQDINGLAIGWYYATITDQNLCQLHDSAEVVNINGPSLVISSIDETCGSTNGQVFLSVNNGTSPYTYSWSNGATTQNLNYVLAGSYLVTVTDANGCSDFSSATIINIQGPTSVTLGSQNSVCGNGNGSVWVEVTGGTTPYSYLWNTSPAQANDTAYNLVGGSSYSVTVTDSNSCFITGTIALINIAGPSSSITKINCTCGEYNGAADLIVSAGTAPYSFTWSNGETTEDIDSLQPGTYSVTITDANGCTSISSTNVLDLFGPYISYTANNTTCGNSNGSIDVTVLGGTAPFFYNWNSGQYATQDLLNLAAGSFTLELADAAGCQVDSTIILIDVPGPTVNATSNPSTCGYNNGSVLAAVVGGTSPFTYSWSNASIDSFANNLFAGTYTVQVTDSNGCIANASTTLLNIAGPALSLSYTNATCGLNNALIDLTVTNGTSPFTYDWNTGLYNTQDLSNLDSGTYYVVVVDSNTCMAIALQNISSSPAPILSSIITNASCENANGNIDVTVTSGTAPYNFYWNNGSTSEDIDSLVAGTYYLTVTDGSGCVLIDSFSVTGSSQPVLSLASINANCGINDGAIDLTITNGTLPFIINWSNGSTSEDLDSLGAGNYVVSLTDSFGCIAADSVIIIQNNGPELTANATNESCAGNDGAVNIDISGGTLPLTIIWSNGATTEDISAVLAGSYFVTVTDANGCTAVATADVLPATPPSISYTNTNTNCGASTGTIDVSVFGGSYPLNYLWSNGATTEDLDSLVAGIYFITLTDAASCAVVDSITITDAAAPTISIAVIQPSCLVLSSVTITASGGTGSYNYNWSNGLTFASVLDLFAGDYTITVTDSVGCFVIDSITIDTITTVSVVVDSTVTAGCNNSGAIYVSAIGGTSPFTYAWSNGATTQNISSITANSYSVTVTDSLGCVATTTATITNSTAPTISLIATNANCNQADGSIDLTVVGGTSPYNYNWSNGSTTEDISSLSIGTYAVTVTDMLGCSVIDSIAVGNNSGPSIIPTVFQPTCSGTFGAISFTTTGGNGIYTYTWSNGDSTTSINNLSAGNYSVTVSDSVGCAVTGSFTINSPSTPTVVVDSTFDAGCNNTGAIYVSVSGGISPFTYSWSNGSTTEDITNLSAGIYSVIVTDSLGCIATTNTTINNSIPQTVNATSTNESCNNANGTITLTVTGGASPFTYTWNNGATTQNLANLSAGTYDVTVTDSFGCVATTPATITNSTAPTILMIAVNANCNQADGSIDLTVAGGTSPYNYNWSTGATTEDITSLAIGNYVVTVNDVLGCSVIDSMVVGNNNGPSITSVVVQPTCAGTFGSISLTITGGNGIYSYTWSNGETTANISSLTANSYSVTVTDGVGCAATDAFTINNSSTPIAVVDSTFDAGCNNTGAIYVSVSGGIAPYNYSWSNAATTEDITNLSAGIYTVIITDSLGCVTSTNATINNSIPQTLSLTSTNESCNNANGTITLTVTGGASPFTYAWSNAATTANISSLTANSYSVTVTDSLGCVATTTATITNSTAPTISLIATNANCNQADGSVDLTVVGGTSPYTYNWNNGSTTEDISSLSIGTYAVTVTDMLGCSVIDSINISSTAAPVLALTMINANCNQTDGTIDLTISGGVSPYIILWSNAATTEDLNGVGAGNYTVVVNDITGCSVTSTIAVGNNNGPSITATAVDAGCLNNNGSVDITISGGATPYIFTWSNGSTSEDILNLSSGSYSVTVTDNAGCQVLSTSVINAATAPVSALTSSSANCNQNNGSVNLTVTNGSAPYTYLWSNGATTANLSSLTANNYSVTITDVAGCIISDSISVGNLNGPSISATQVQSTCGNANASINISITGGISPYTIIWSNGATTTNISSLTANNYSVTVTDAAGCSVIDSFNITTTVAPTLALSMNNSSCGLSNGTIDLTISGGVSPYSILWNNSATTEDLFALVSGNYFVTVTDAAGCTVTGSILVGNNLSPVLSATVINETCLNSDGAIDVTTTGGTLPFIYLWNNGSTSEDLSSLAAGNYSVTVTDANGCTASTAATIISSPTSPVATLSAATANCNQSNGQINLTVSSGTAPYSYSWSNGQTTEDINNIAAGNYIVTITDAAGCAIQDSIFVGNTNGPVITSTMNAATCGNANGSISITVAGGVLPYTYNWSNGATTTNISMLTANSYSVTVSDAAGCLAFDLIILNTTMPPVSALTMTNSNCNQNDGSVDLTITSGTAPYNYSWSNGSTTEDLTGIISGNYSVTVIDVNGCSTTDSISVGDNQGPELSVASLDATCTNDNGSIDVSISGGVSPYSYNWNNGATTEDLSGLSAGNYFVTVTDANGCTANASATILAAPSPFASSIATSTNCNNANGAINITVTNGFAPYTYLWSNGETTQDIDSIVAGNYTVTITDVAGCVITNSTAVLNINGPSINSILNQSTCENPNGAIDITIAGGVLPYTYFWNTFSVNQDLINIASGNYYVTVTDAVGCVAVDSFIINTTPLPVLALIAVNANCAQADGSVDLTISAGASPYLINWDNGATTEDLNNVVAAFYSVIVTDANGCAVSDTIAVDNNNGPIASYTTINSTCGSNNGSLDLSVTGGSSPYTFIWNNGSTTEDIAALFPGNYLVTVTDASGCNAYSLVSILTTPLPVAVFITTPTNCNQNNGTINLTASVGASPYTYVWSNGETTEDIDSVVTGIYSVTITDSLGCVGIDSIVVNNLNGPAVSLITTQPSCSSMMGAIDASVTGSVPPYTYAWSNGATTQNIDSLFSGYYYVTVTDAIGCQSIDTTIINDLSTPYIELDIITNVNCSTTGAISISMSGGNAPYTFVWSNGSTTEDLYNLLAGNYALTVTDNSGCTDTISAIVGGAFAQTISLTSVPSNCNISNGTVDLNVVGGIAPYNFLWNNGSTTEDLDSLVAGFYTATVTDAQGCITIDSVVVGNIAGPFVTSIIIQPTCSIATGSVDLTVTDGTAPYSFLWNNAATTEDLNSIVGGNYSATITDAIGCQTFGTYSLIGISPINLAVNTVAPICQGDSALLNATGAVTYSWTPNFGLSGTTDSSVYASPSVSMTYVVTGFDGLGCFDTASVVVNVNPLPTISSASVNSMLCYGDSTLIVVNGGSTYTWLPSTGINFISNDSAIVQPTASTTYTITGIDSFGCSSSTTIAVGVMPQISMVISSPDTSLCSGETTTMIATGALNYTWSPATGLNATTGSNVTASPSQTTIYYVTGVDANGCQATDSLIVVVHPPVVITVNPMNPTICAGSSVNLSATGAVTYTWSPSDGLNVTTGSTVVATPSITTTYIVTGTDSFGCVGYNAVIVSIGTSLALNLNNNAPVICAGTSTTFIVGGVLNATYNWTPSVTFLDSTGMTVSVNPNSNSTYTVIATDANGCTGTTTATVTVNTPPTITANNAMVCFGTSTTLSVSGAVNYSWSPSTGLSNTTGDTQIASPDSTTTYVIIGMDSLGCADTTVSTVNVNPLPVLTATPSTTSICNGSSAIINVSGAATYQWTPSAGLSADTGSVVTALPLVTTTYSIFGTDSMGCTNMVTAIVNVGAPVVIVNTPMNPSLCFGDSIVISLAGAIDYQWSPSTGLNTSTGAVVVANPTVTTSYTVVGTDLNGCTGSVIINVIINPLPVVTGMNATICAGQSTTLSTSGAYLYMWVADLTLSGYYDSTEIANPLTSTTYSLTGMNIYGCIDTALFVVNVNPLPNVSIDGLDPFYCIASAADSFTVSPMGGTLTGVGLVGNTFDPSLVGIGGPYYVTYTYTDSLGCSNTDIDTTQVNNNAFISASAANAIICTASSTTLTAIGGVTYSWSPSTGLNNTTGSVITANPTITTTYIVNGINAAGCLGSDSVIVTVAPPVQLSIVATADSICSGSSTLIFVNGGMIYTWFPSVNSLNASGDTVNVSPAATTTYTVTGMDVNGCSADTMVIVNIISQPIVTVNSPSICSGDAATLIAQGATSYNWISLASTNDSVTVQPLVTSSYTVIGFTNTCSDTALAVVSMVAPPVISVNNATTCSGIAATLIANGASTYSWMPGSMNGNSVSISPNITTTYTVIGNNGSCADTALSIVTVNPSPVATLSGLNNSYCTNNPADTLIGIPAGGIFSGVGVNGNIFFPSQVAGASTTITYTYTDLLGCSAIDTQTVTMNGGGFVTVNPTSSTICNSSSATITASGANTYTWAPSTGLNVTTGDVVIASPTVNTTYTCTGITATGCIAQTTSEVIISPNILVNVTATNDSICLGQTISMTATGGTTYTWSPSTFLSSTNGTTVSAQPTSNITYTVVATNATGCSGQTIIPIALLPNPVVTVTSDTICVGQFATLIASGAANYHWSTNALGNTISVNPASTTTYSVIGMNGACADTATTFVTVNPLPIINTISSGSFICNGGTVQINASGASTYVWTPSTGLNTTIGSSVTASLTASTTYTVSGVDVNGCANIQSVPVDVALPVTITSNSSDTSICIGQSVDLNVAGATNFTWSPSTGLSATYGTTVSANPITSTTYAVTGTDINGCTAVSFITVNVNPLPVIIASSTSSALCTASSATLSATGAANYFWSPSIGLSATTGNSIQAQPNSSITYTVTGIDSLGCSATSSINILVYPVPTISITSTNPTICFGSSTSLNATGASTYSWSPSTGLNLTNTPSVIASPISTITYTVNAIDVNGCPATSTSVITVQPLPVLVATALDSTLCVGQSTILSVSGALNYIWSPSISLSSATGSFVTANPTVNSTYQVIGTDNLGCQSTTLIPVVINPVASVVIPTIPSICPGEFATLVATGAVNYLWSTNALGDSIAVNPVVNTTYSVTGTDANGCTATATTLVSINPIPTIAAVSSQNNFCAGQTTILTASGTNAYSWSPSYGLNTTTGNTVTSNPTGTTTYTIVGTNSFGCTNSTEIEIVVYQIPMAAAGPDVNLCEGGFAQLSASGGTTYEWIPQTGLDNPYISNPMAAPSISMSYIVNIGNQNGCHAQDTINVTIHVKPNVNAGPSQTVCYPNSALLHGDGAAFYNWSPADYLDDTTLQEPTCTPQFDITYTLTVNDSFGCSASDTVSVKVKLPFTIVADPDVTLCRNDAAQLNAFGGSNYLWTPSVGLDNANISNPTASPSVSTTYTVSSSDGVCFNSSDTVVVTINQLPIIYAGADADLLYGSTYQLYGYTNGGNIEWSPADYLSCTDCINPIVNHLNTPMTYTLTATDSLGCRAEDAVHISLTCNEDLVYVPNAFTPNGDNKNDIFRIRTYGLSEVKAFRVFNRWGEMVFETYDVNQGWDGTWQGQACSPAVFVYYLEGTCANGQEVLKHGNVTLIR